MYPGVKSATILINKLSKKSDIGLLFLFFRVLPVPKPKVPKQSGESGREDSLKQEQGQEECGRYNKHIKEIHKLIYCTKFNRSFNKKDFTEFLPYLHGNFTQQF